MKPSLNRATIFKLVVHEIELHTAFGERENKQKNAKLYLNNFELSFFSHKIAFSNANLWVKKDNSKLQCSYMARANVYK